MKIAILDDYQNVALRLADWSHLRGRADISVFNDHQDDREALIARLALFEVIVVMRERTPLPREVLERLPKLQLIVSTGARNASIDTQAAAERGIAIMHTGYRSDPTVELTWALILGAARQIVPENESVRRGEWQTAAIGMGLRGKTLGVLGLGNVGSEVAKIGLAFGMTVIAWSQNLTAEAAREAGATLVSKDELFARADVVTIHLVLSARTRSLVGAAELAMMKPSALLVNASRGPIVDEAALVSALRNDAIAGAALDVFDTEPLPPGHPFRELPNVLATPHLGYVADDLYRIFYGDAATNIDRWLAERQARV